MTHDAAQLEVLVGYKFTSSELLRRALTHSSWAHETPTAETPAAQRHNEQLEFLGDSVLGLLVSDALVSHFPDWSEGALSRMKAHLVSAAHLSKVASRLDLGRFLVIGRGEEMSGGRSKPALLANALEAVIAALYLDGGIGAAAQFIREWVIADTFESPETSIPAESTDYIGQLIQHTRGHKMVTPQFIVLEERGPQHAKVFVMQVKMGRTVVGQGEGANKRAASQKAAQQALESLRIT